MKSKTPLRRLAMILTVLLSVLLLPDEAAAVELYDVWVGGTQVTSGNAGNVLGDGKVSFDPVANTLKLNNAAITGAATPGSSARTAGIYSKIPLIIEVTGTNNTVAGVDAADGESYGILSENTLNVTGGGTLTVTAAKGKSSSEGILSQGFTLESGTVIATGGESVPLPSDDIIGGVSTGLRCENAPLIVKEAGTLTATGGIGDRLCDGVAIRNTDLKIEGGTLTATGGQATEWSAGISIQPSSPGLSSFTMAAGTVTAKGGTGKGSFGVFFANTDVQISGGIWTATGGEAVTASAGMSIGSSSFTMTGGTVIATGGKRTAIIPGAGSFGVSLNDTDLQIEGGILTATGGETQYESEGISMIGSSNLILNGGTLTATGGAVTGLYSSGIDIGGTSSFTMTGGILEAVSESASGFNSYGIDGLSSSVPVIKGGTAIFRGADGGTTKIPDTNGYTDPFFVTVDDNAAGSSPELWDDTTPLNDQSFQYVKIQPGTAATVSFNGNGGGDTMADVIILKGSSYTLPGCGFTAPEGKIFKAWSIGGVEKQPGASIDVTGDTVVTAQWKPATCIVTFLNRSGDVYATTTVDHGSVVSAPTTDPTEDGYDFDGWDFTFSTPITADTNITSQWTQLHTVSFDANGGESTDLGDQEVRDGGYATAPNPPPTKAGYDFLGWYKDGAPFDFDTPITTDTELKAEWEQKTYTVRFLDRNSNAYPEMTIENVLHGSTVSEPATDPTEDGWDFDGWDFTFSTPITADTNIASQWTQLHTVSFELAGGTPAQTAQEVRNGEYASAPTEAPTREGYNFLGWYKGDSPTAFDFENTEITASITLTAKWEQKAYTVRFLDRNSNAYPEMTIENVLHGSTVSEPTTDPTEDGWDFDGWDFTFSTSITEDTNITSKWTKLHTVSFEPAGGESTDLGDQEVRDGEKASVPNSPPTKEGHNFLGWYEGDSPTAFDFENTEITASITLTAKWEQVKFSVSGYVWYDDGDGLHGDSHLGGVPGVYVKILDADGRRIAWTKTDADGCYSFDGLEAGTYTVQFYNIPRGCRIAPSYVGDDRTRDSDGLKRTVTLTGDLEHHDLGLLKQSVRSTRRR